ncbi:hypothetical protein FJ251_09195, partial [bacterium]|nr:hypothetical protein [bacterium]
MLHQSQSARSGADAHRLRPRLRRRRLPHQLHQELQFLLGRPAPDPARGGEADRQTRRVHRIRSGGPALLLGGQHQEPPGELLPDDRSQAPGAVLVKCYVGIDLGSTTTKAIVLDAEGGIVGRGLTNSRSDYMVAAAVAQNEAYINARFELLRKLLHGDESQATDEYLHRLRIRFRYEQIHEHYRHLRERCLAGAEEKRGSDGDLARTVDEIFTAMEEKLADHIASFGDDESLFFRDVAGSLYMALAETAARRWEVSFDLLIGLYDRAILLVEGQLLEQSFRDCAEAALAGLELPMGNDLDAEVLRQAVAEVAGVEF